MMEERDYILFETYLSGTISGEEKKELEMRLEKDSALKEAFILYRETSAHLESTFGKEEETAAFREKVGGISDAYFRNRTGKDQKVRKLRSWQLAVAASVLVIMGIFLSRKPGAPEYGDYADYPEISLVVRGVSNEVLLAAETAFNTGNYGQAAALFEKIRATDDTDPEISLYHGISLVELNRFEEADTIFSRLMATGSVLRYDAMWYGALSRLKQKDPGASADILKRIPEDADRYRDAQKLLKKLP